MQFGAQTRMLTRTSFRIQGQGHCALKDFYTTSEFHYSLNFHL